jgi:glycosyltransferase involved in cell wall biosynthesis
MSKERLLVTFALFTYNQEAYVAEAVEGALSQDYSPLEIIISDDASTDRTFDIIRDMVDRYRGPHEIRLIRNEVNLGIGAHVTKVANLARGELIVAAAGDDVSRPSRSAAMAALWSSHDYRPDLLYCNVEMIDSHGRSRGVFRTAHGNGMTAIRVARDGYCALGAATTWTKRLWREHPGLPAECTIEDQALSLRAVLSGGVVHHVEPLVRYRVGASIRSRQPPADDPLNIRFRLDWARRMRPSLATQAEDAARLGRRDLRRHLVRRERTQALIERIYMRSNWPATAHWRGVLGLRGAREVIGAIIATRFPELHVAIRRFRSGGRADGVARIDPPLMNDDRW